MNFALSARFRKLYKSDSEPYRRRARRPAAPPPRAARSQHHLSNLRSRGSLEGVRGAACAEGRWRDDVCAAGSRRRGDCRKVEVPPQPLHFTAAEISQPDAYAYVYIKDIYIWEIL